ncbi:hypothetical protein CL619_02085 [archaeon]|nr:hypothetical protein [archaeon]
MQEKFLYPPNKAPLINLNLSGLWKNFNIKEYISKEHLLLAICLIAIPQIKNNGIFIFPILFLASVYESRELVRTIKELSLPFLLGVLGNIAILGVSYILDPEYISMLFTHGGSRVAPGISVLAIMLILFWATPYLLGLFGLSLFDKETKKQKHTSLFIIWVLTILVLIICFVSTGDYSRYAMNIIPAIAILSGLYLSKIIWDKKTIIFTSIVGLAYLAITYIINIIPREITPRVMEEYVTNILNGNIFFLFSYTSSSGPIFGITMASFILTLVISTILFILTLIPKNKFFKISNKQHLILILLATTLAFNIFLVGEFIFNFTSPNVSESILDMEEYFIEQNFPYPIYSNNAGTLFMLDNQNEISNKSQGVPDFELHSNITKTKKMIDDYGGTALIINWPPLPEYSPLWDAIETCTKEATFTSDDYEVGWVYSC